MTPAEITALYEALQSHAASLGLFDDVGLHIPENSPPKRWCSIYISDIAPIARASGLASTAGRLEFTVITGSTAQVRPLDALDPAVTCAAVTLLGEYSGSFTLGGTVLAIDLAGMWGPALSAKAAWADFGGARYRVMEITLPVIVDDLWTQGA